ncbi:major capsid protein [Labrys wisconsinensis]|uniref:Major capsid protein n=1 Tax=Labrys wisconsinensis TaxID=425677 RepID=A0ABU0JEV1_9HYPH|nr:major capsid protein [Labrys wisconsinensis]MDQ0472811.1 hypothetical protein [Labrys wisconsinensis]
MATLYDTHTLARVLEAKVQTPRTFLLEKFYPSVMTFDTETVDLDIITRGAKLAPFVHEDAPGRPVTTGGYVTKLFKPLPMKMNDAVNPAKAMKRRAGERYAGEVTPADRLEALTVDKIAEQRKAWLRRLEWFAATMLRDAALTIATEDLGDAVLDLGRDAGLKVTLAGANRWGQAGVSPVDNLEAWLTLVLSKSGVFPTDVVFGTEAWKLFRVDPKFDKFLDRNLGRSDTVEIAPVDVSMGALMGRVGNTNIWVYQQTYEDDAGNAQKFIDDYDVILASQAIEGIRAFGAVPTESTIVSIDLYQTVYTDNNPPRRFAYTESRGIVVMGRPNASARFKVQ